MFKLKVDTYPVKAYVRIYRVTPGYGTMAKGISPVTSPPRATPWSYNVELFPFVDAKGNLWLPNVPNELGTLLRNTSRNFKYVNVGPAAAFM